MANHASALKRYRQSLKKRAQNQTNRHKLKTQMKKLKVAIASGKKDEAAKALKAAAPVLARNAQKGVLHKKTASRKVSRLSARVKAMAN